jgi:hypothetical protein
MDDTASFSSRSNAKRAAERIISKGTAPALGAIQLRGVDQNCHLLRGPELFGLAKAGNWDAVRNYKVTTPS